MLSMDIESCKINIEGKEYPAVGFGTYRLTGEVCRNAVLEAIQTGYRIIDTATYYANFAKIAEALKGRERERFYLISKVWHDMQEPDNIRRDFENTLRELETDYLDAYFIHWPNSKIPIEESLETMRDLSVRHIGLSNVTVNHLRRALEAGVKISWVQTEMHPMFYDKDLLEFCQSQGIGHQAWRPLNQGGVKDDKLLSAIGIKYGKTPAQIALRWILQHGSIPIPGSKTPQHIQENFQIQDFSLSDEEMLKIDARAASGNRVRLSGKHGFSDEFDFTYEECWPKQAR